MVAGPRRWDGGPHDPQPSQALDRHPRGRRGPARRSRTGERAGPAPCRRLRHGGRGRDPVSHRGQLPRRRGRRPPAPVRRVRAEPAAGHRVAAAGGVHVPRELGHRRAVPGRLRLARAGRRDGARGRLPDGPALSRARQRPPLHEVERVRPRRRGGSGREAPGLPGRRAVAGGRRLLRRLDHGRSGSAAADRPHARLRVRLLQRGGVRGPPGRRALTRAGRGRLRRGRAARRPGAARRPIPMWLVVGSLDDRVLAHTGPPPLAELPLDPAALLAEPVVDSKARRPPRHGRARRAPVGYARPARTPRPSAGPRSARARAAALFRFSPLAGLEHHYPHVRNNDAGFEAAPEFWDFFATHRLR